MVSKDVMRLVPAGDSTMSLVFQYGSNMSVSRVMVKTVLKWGRFRETVP